MARKSIDAVEPDIDDLDGQGDENRGEFSNEQRPIDPATVGNGGGNIDDGDRYARDDAGNIVYTKSGKPALKRGRKPGSTGFGSQNSGKKNNQALKDSIDSLANMLGFIHIGAAGLFKTPELELTENEQQKLARATSNVMQHFEVNIDPKIEAIVGLAGTAIGIYTPRIYLISSRRKEEAKEKRKAKEEERKIDKVSNGGFSFDPAKDVIPGIGDVSHLKQ